jgi:hypothetical protein
MLRRLKKWLCVERSFWETSCAKTSSSNIAADKISRCNHLNCPFFPSKVIELLSQGKKYYDSLFGDAELGM